MPTNNKAKDLKDSLRFTYLDVENAGFRSGSVTGFGFNNKDLKTQYPSTTTGKPTPTQYPRRSSGKTSPPHPALYWARSVT